MRSWTRYCLVHGRQMGFSVGLSLLLLLGMPKRPILVVIFSLATLAQILAGCQETKVSVAIGRWRSSAYPATPPQKPIFLEILKNGDYSYSSFPGHGRWTVRGDVLVLNRYSGTKQEEFTIQGHPKMLRNTETDGVDYLPIPGKAGGG